jgi:UDP-N-acetylglucosamine 2-epimerase
VTAKVGHLIAAARPNLMEIRPLYHALQAQEWCRPQVVRGQHHDSNLSDSLLRAGKWPEGRTPDLWDGPTVDRAERSLRARP